MHFAKAKVEREFSFSDDERLSVLLLDEKHARASSLYQALLDYGYEVIQKLEDPGLLGEAVIQHSPDALIMSLDSLDRETLLMLSRLKAVHPLPVIIFAEQDSPTVIDQAVKAGVSAYVVDGFHAERLRPIIAVAVARFRERQALETELEKTRTKLAERKLLDRAKGLLMKQKNLSEDEAYQQLRKMAMNRGVTLSVAAEMTIEVLSMLDN